MDCFCKNKPVVNIVNVYQNCNLVYKNEGYFEIVCLPKVCIKQRLAKDECFEEQIRIIIKLYNFERISFQNIHLINELNTNPKEICIKQIDGIWTFKDNKLDVMFPEILDTSVYTIDYIICIDKIDCLESAVYIKDKNIVQNDKELKKCITSLKL